MAALANLKLKYEPFEKDSNFSVISEESEVLLAHKFVVKPGPLCSDLLSTPVPRCSP